MLHIIMIYILLACHKLVIIALSLSLMYQNGHVDMLISKGPHRYYMLMITLMNLCILSMLL